MMGVLKNHIIPIDDVNCSFQMLGPLLLGLLTAILSVA
jgi:hypothetical protein